MEQDLVVPARLHLLVALVDQVSLFFGVLPTSHSESWVIKEKTILPGKG